MLQRFTLCDQELTGIQSLDEQHRQLLNLVDRAVAVENSHLGPTWFREALSTFVEYAQYHFAAEEHMMQLAEYPELNVHRQEHDDFRLEASELIDAARRDADSTPVRERLITLCSTWVSLHVTQADKALADFMLDRRPRESIRLPDSATLRSAGALVADVESAGTTTLADAQHYVHPTRILDVG
jgi:hemerythrin